MRSLYDLYPAVDIDAAAERTALGRASVVVWQHPIYRYNVPALLKLWFERVLTPGWNGRSVRPGAAPTRAEQFAPPGLHGFVSPRTTLCRSHERTAMRCAVEAPSRRANRR